MFETSINEAKKLLSKTDDRAHDINHARRVSENAVSIGKRLDHKNIELLELCGWWHDVGRTIRDAGHEKISAEMLYKDLIKRQKDIKLSKSAYDAIVFHRWDMNPQTLEGKIIRDADKLDFISIERWQACIEHGQFKHLRDMKTLLDQLPDLLKLDVSVEIYLKKIIMFKKSRLIDLVK